MALEIIEMSMESKWSHMSTLGRQVNDYPLTPDEVM